MPAFLPVPYLPWPRSLFRDHVVAAQPLQQQHAIKRPYREPMRCENPICVNMHNYAVSRVVGDYGHRRVLFYCNMRCRNMHLVEG